MKRAEAFLEAMDKKAKVLARGARATYEANTDLCSWLLDPLARWAEAAYGEKVFEEAARGYASYCMGVAQAQRIYESAGRYTPEAMPEIMSGVYEDEGYMVPYMWAAILIYAFWPSMVNHLALFRNNFLRRLPTGARVLELACGHGVLSLLAAEERPDIQVEGVDISPPRSLWLNAFFRCRGTRPASNLLPETRCKRMALPAMRNIKASFRRCSLNICRNPNPCSAPWAGWFRRMASSISVPP